MSGDPPVAHTVEQADGTTAVVGGGATTDGGGATTAATDTGRRPRAAGLAALLLETGLLVGAAALTVLRFTVEYLNADGVEMSTMSVQDVQLFFWGQDRLFPIPAWLASPIADPVLNLRACLLISAFAFYGLLLLLAHKVAHVVHRRSPFLAPTVFACLCLAGYLVLSNRALYVLAIEGQPYALSYLLTIGGFLLWRRGRWWSRAIALLLSCAALGSNPSTLVLAAVLAAAELLRRWRWVSWIVYGACWIAMFVMWDRLSDRFGEWGGPYDQPAATYLAFDIDQFDKSLAPMVQSMALNLQAFNLAVGLGLAALSAVLLPRYLRSQLLLRGAAVGVFVLLACGFFLGNPWLARNNYEIRYVAPALLLLLLLPAVPIALALGSPVRLPLPRRRRSTAAATTDRSTVERADSVDTAAVAAATPADPAPSVGATGPARRRPSSWRPAVAAVALSALSLGLLAATGPLDRPEYALVLKRTEPLAEYARANDIRFVSGDYWLMWPTLQTMLRDGRQSGHVVGYKSGGDPAGYRKAFDEALADDPHPKAICVEADDSFCTRHLDIWTKPGWRRVEPVQSCPVPNRQATPLPSGAPGTCVVLEYVGR